MKKDSYFDEHHPVVVSPSLWEMGFKASWLALWNKLRGKKKKTDEPRDSPK